MQHHLGARPRAAGLDEAQMPRRTRPVERQLELADPTALAPVAQQRADAGVVGGRPPRPSRAGGGSSRVSAATASRGPPARRAQLERVREPADGAEEDHADDRHPERVADSASSTAPEAAPACSDACPRGDGGQRGEPEAHAGADQQQPGREQQHAPAGADVGDRGPAGRGRRPAPAAGGQHAASVALGQRRRPQRGGQVGAARIVNTRPAAARQARDPAGGTGPGRGRTTPGRTRTRSGQQSGVNARSRNRPDRAAAPAAARSRRWWATNATRMTGAARAATSTAASRAAGPRRAAARSRSARR